MNTTPEFVDTIVYILPELLDNEQLFEAEVTRELEYVFRRRMLDVVSPAAYQRSNREPSRMMSFEQAFEEMGSGSSSDGARMRLDVFMHVFGDYENAHLLEAQLRDKPEGYLVTLDEVKAVYKNGMEGLGNERFFDPMSRYAMRLLISVFFAIVDSRVAAIRKRNVYVSYLTALADMSRIGTFTVDHINFMHTFEQYFAHSVGHSHPYMVSMRSQITIASKIVCSAVLTWLSTKNVRISGDDDAIWVACDGEEAAHITNLTFPQFMCAMLVSALPNGYKHFIGRQSSMPFYEFYSRFGRLGDEGAINKIRPILTYCALFSFEIIEDTPIEPKIIAHFSNAVFNTLCQNALAFFDAYTSASSHGGGATFYFQKVRSIETQRTCGSVIEVPAYRVDDEQEVTDDICYSVFFGLCVLNLLRLGNKSGMVKWIKERVDKRNAKVLINKLSSMPSAMDKTKGQRVNNDYYTKLSQIISIGNYELMLLCFICGNIPSVCNRYDHCPIKDFENFLDICFPRYPC